ncbi:hypothetical protein KUTeg_020637 [Tegillarca granosa]|uniref:Uncharacterized protein n=1 Tax=Tegillarca granosa TaxID=220873 RepID=A0ABQ9EDY5_TEGGR|nr:hypothetical protein KUTeg_020637 [Tegillarca granosa]
MSLIKGCPGVLYRSTDDRIRLYCCDVYAFNKSVEGQFQYIWDRGAFWSISKAKRNQWRSFILVKWEARRLCTIVSETIHLTLDYRITVKGILIKRLYPEQLINHGISKTRSIEETELRRIQIRNNENIIPFDIH